MMITLDGRTLASGEALGSATDFLPRIMEVVGHDSLFSRIGVEEVDYLARHMTCYRVPAGTILIREGSSSGVMVFIIDGTLEIRKQRLDGGETVLTHLGPGNTLGEMSMFDDRPRVASCVAVEPVTFAILGRGDMETIMRQNPALATKVLIQFILILSDRLHQATDALSETLRAQS